MRFLARGGATARGRRSGSATPTHGLVRLGVSLVSQGAEQFTGTHTYVRELLRGLGSRPSAARVEVLAHHRAHEALRDWAGPAVQMHTAEGLWAASSHRVRVAALAGSAMRSGRLGRRFSPGLDLVHFPLTLPAPTVDLPRVVTLHDVQHHARPESFSRAQRLWRRRFYDGSARAATLVITVTHHARGQIIEFLGLEPERVVAIHLGVDLDRFGPTPGADEEELLRQLELPSRFVLYPASYWPHKNHARLFEAMRAVDEDVHLVLTGGTFGRLDELLACARGWGVGRRVHHRGFVSDAALPALYRRAAALVFPSAFEGFGVPPLEAMASGCPVASSRAGGLREVVGQDAHLLDPENPPQMAGAIGEVVYSATLRAGLRTRGLARAATFPWHAAVDRHLAAYRTAVAMARSL